jgi:hypothetical protein
MARATIQIPAIDFNFALSRNVSASSFDSYGDVITNTNAGEQPDRAVWRFQAEAGTYQLSIEYAAAQSRPVMLLLNGVTLTNNGLSEITNGWVLQCQQWAEIGSVDLVEGENIFTISRDDVIPHIRTIKFVPE